MSTHRKLLPNALSMKKKSTKKRTLLKITFLFILILVCFAGGVTLGLLFGFYIPEIHITNNGENEFKFLSRNNKIVIGGDLKILMEIKNRAIFSSVLYSDKLQYFYYPIGKSYACLLYNGGLENEAKEPPLNYRSEISIPLQNNEMYVHTKLSVSMRRTFLNESKIQKTIPLILGYEITEELKEEVQSLYNDCKNFQRIFFSIRLNNIYVTNSFTKVTYNKLYEFVFYTKCFIDKAVDEFFNVQPKNKRIILQGLNNTPDLIK